MKLTIELNTEEMSKVLASGTLETMVNDVKSLHAVLEQEAIEPIMQKDQPKEQPKTQKTESSAKTKAKAKAEPAPEPAPEPAEPAEPDQEVSIEQVRATFMEKNSPANRAHLKGLLDEYGVKKVTDLDPKHYPVILKALETLS